MYISLEYTFFCITLETTSLAEKLSEFDKVINFIGLPIKNNDFVEFN